MSTLYDKASLIITPNAYKTSKIYAAKPTDGSGDLTFSRAGTAMRRNSSGLWESVASNIPRLSYPIGGGCPSWLFEPQTTCLIPNCNIFAGSTIKTIGIVDSPISGVTSVRLTKDSAATQYAETSYSATIASATNYALSLFFKYDGHDIDSSLEFNNGGDWGALAWKANIEIRSTGITIVLQQNCTAVLVAETNGWYRLEVSLTTGTVTNNSGSILIKASGSNGASFLVCTSNLTQSREARSPILTAGANVTRVADALSLDIVDLPSFTLLLVVAQHEAYPGSASFFPFSASGVEGNVYLYGGYSLQYYSPSTGYLGTAVSTVNGCKLLVRGNGVGTNNITVFKNGLNIAQGSNPNSSLHGIQFSINTLLQLGNLIVFPSALTDAECIAITTP